MSEITIRRLGPEDAADFRAIRLRGLRDHPDAFSSTAEAWDLPLEAFAERIRQAHVIGAFDGARIIGTCMLSSHLDPGEKVRHKVDLWSVYLVPEARGTGAARRMLAFAIAEAKRLGYDWLKLQVGEHNPAARKLYSSLGFVEYGREEDYLRLPDGRSVTELLMQKRL